MKTQFVTMGMLIAALTTATAFADDAQTQMNGQMGAAPSTTMQSPAQSSSTNSTDSSATGNTDNTMNTSNPPATPSQNSN